MNDDLEKMAADYTEKLFPLITNQPISQERAKYLIKRAVLFGFQQARLAAMVTVKGKVTTEFLVDKLANLKPIFKGEV